jgi:hypothetical protein
MTSEQSGFKKQVGDDKCAIWLDSLVRHDKCTDSNAEKLMNLCNDPRRSTVALMRSDRSLLSYIALLNPTKLNQSGWLDHFGLAGLDRSVVQSTHLTSP